MEHIACCSFGKDSLATIILAKENNEPLDEIIFSEVMFNDKISGENPIHIKWIKDVAIPMLEDWGYKVVILKSKETYVSLFEKVIFRSKHKERNGKLRGFPMAMACHCNSALKIKPIKEYLKDKECVQYVGIAIDETKRLESMHKRNNTHISLLEKYGYTEKMAFELCKKYKLLSPLYELGARGGCWFCPNRRLSELKHLYKNNIDIWEEWKELYFKNKQNMIRTAYSFSKEFEDLIKDVEQETKQIGLFKET